MNLLIILVEDFRVGPSLFSMFLGLFGLDLVVCLLVNNKEIEKLLF
jgi:hypothetical protein